MLKRASWISYLVVVAWCCGCAGRPPNWAPSDVDLADRVEMPCEFPAHGLPVIVVNRSTANDQAAVNETLAVIDTGAAASVVTSKYAKSHKLEVRNVGDLRMVDALKQEKKTPQVANFKSLKLAGASFENFDALLQDLDSMQQLSEKLDLILARPVFRDVLLTIDYPKRRLILERGSIPEPNGRDVLPLKSDDQGHLLVRVRLMNEDAWMILDTGYTGDGLQLSKFRLIAMPWGTQPVEGDKVHSFLGITGSKIGRMNGDVTIGQYTIHRPIVAISYDNEREYLGSDFLSNFVVTIDQKNSRVRLARATTRPIETPAVARLGFTFVDERGKIDVIPDSGAQRAGLKSGDIIRAINGVSVERLTYLHREAFERAGEPILVRFERDGHEMVQRVPITVIVP